MVLLPFSPPMLGDEQVDRIGLTSVLTDRIELTLFLMDGIGFYSSCSLGLNQVGWSMLVEG